MAHHHPAQDHPAAPKGRAFAVGLAINLAYMAGEIAGGIMAHSLALLADAAHNASDALGLLGALVAGRLALRAASTGYTYGLRRASILAALANAVLLLTVTGGIAWEAVLRLFAAPHVGGETVMLIAAGGIAVNGGTALLFIGDHADLNIRSAFLHMAGDAVMAAATVAAGAIIWLTHWYLADPLISLLVAGAIITATWSLLRNAVAMAMDAVPQGMDAGEIAAALAALPGVASVHDLHVWPVSTTETALTAHLVRHAPADDGQVLAAARHRLEEGFGIHHATLQLEAADSGCVCAFAAER